MAFLSVLIRCCYIGLLILATQWKGNSPNVVKAISSGMDFPPMDLRAVANTPTSIVIMWAPPESANDNTTITYNVSYYYMNETSVTGSSIITNNTMIMFEDLEEGIEYYITVETIYDGVPCGIADVNVTTRAPVPIAPPSNITLLDVDPAMLTVMYDRVPEQFHNDVSGYVIRYRRVDVIDPQSYSNVTVKNSTIMEVNITGLVAYVNYSVEVAAIDSYNNIWNFSDALYSLSGQDIPSAPTSLMITTQSRSLNLSWMAPDTPNGIITHYELWYIRNDNESLNVTSYIADTISLNHSIEGLMPGVTYVLQLKAYTRVGPGPYVSQTVATELEQPELVTNVSVPDENISSSEVTVNWMEVDKQAGVNISYRVFYQPVQGPYGPIASGNRRRRQLDQEFTMDFTGPPGTLTNLNGSVTYKIQVAAIARALYSDQRVMGNRSEAIMIITSTGTPTVPHNLNHDDLTQNSILVMWQRPDPPNGLILLYTVSYNGLLQYYDQETDTMRMFTSNDTTNVSVANKSSSSVNITNLRVGTNYQIFVVAYTSAGPGAPANISVSTLPDAPPNPRAPQVSESETTDTTAVIRIQQGSDINGPIQYFTIILAIASDTNVSITDGASIGPYNKSAADQAHRNGQLYAYIAGIVRTSAIDNYPHSYTLGNGSESRNGDTGYVDVPLQADTQYIVVVRAYTTDELFADSAAVMVTTMAARADDTAGAEDMPIGIIVGAAVSSVMVIVISIVAVTLLLHFLQKKSKSHSKESNSNLDYNHAVVLQNMHSCDSGYIKTQTSVTTLLDDYVGIEGKPFTFPSYLSKSYKSTPDLRWYLNGKDALECTSAMVDTNGQLILSAAAKEHEGEWSYEVNNTFGSDDVKFKGRLKVKSFEAPQLEYLPVPVSEFGVHVNQLHVNKNRLFEEQFETLYDGEGMSKIIGSKAGNKCKNRFLNIVVYDGNRIALTPIGQYTDGYINASPIDGCKGEKEYIAAQGPTEGTLNDFWRLIWQEHPPTIVMVTNLMERDKVKCVKYWPSTIGHNLTVGPFQILMEEEQIFADYIIRKLQVVKLDSPKYAHTLKQFHFTAWPDHGVPEYATSILMLHSKVIESHNSSEGPILVHCSAGVGRTGTFIAIDIALKQVKKDGAVDIYNNIDKLRHQRPHMVQTLDQYMFIHDAILESITCGNTQINVTNLQKVVNKLKQKDQVTSLTGFEQQLKVLEQVSPKLEDQVCTSGMKHPERNRAGHDLPVEKFRVVLKSETPDYINASYVKGYKQKNAFIVAQSPTEKTIRDFWRMVFNLKCATIVMLCEFTENGREICAPYWFNGKTVTYDDITIANISEVHYDDSTKRVFQITAAETNESHQVTQLHYHGWEAYKTPSSSAGLLNMIEVIQRIQRRTTNRPIVVHCSNGIGRSGTFCVLYTVLEKMKIEKVVDVFQTVKLLRIQKPGLVEDLDQYCFIFSAALQYLQSFETYSNFA